MKPYLLAFICIIFCLSFGISSCNSNKETKELPEKNWETTYLSEVDISKINTLEDCDTMIGLLRKEYDSLSIKAVREYEATSALAKDKYMAERLAAVTSIRARYPDLYFKWLDAKEMDDYVKSKAIEEMPEFTAFRKAERLHEASEEIDRNGSHSLCIAIHSEFQQKSTYIYDFYKSKNEN